MHKHKCGFGLNTGGDPLELIMTPPDLRPKGCGFEWEHENMDIQHVGEAAAVAAHHCPRCGLGEWDLQYNPRAVDALKRLTELFHGTSREVLRAREAVLPVLPEAVKR